MGWQDILGKLKLVDAKIQGEQVGLVNIKSGNQPINYYIHFANPETAKAFAEGIKKPAFEQNVKEKAKKQLEPISRTLDIVSDSTAAEIIVATVGQSALEAMPSEDVGVSDKPIIKITKSSGSV
jgi:diphthamide synthase (EF-2-diphthine--ammonia ligase)